MTVFGNKGEQIEYIQIDETSHIILIYTDESIKTVTLNVCSGFATLTRFVDSKPRFMMSSK